MLNRSAYSSEVVYGFKAQHQSGAAQLVPNQKGARGSIVGMSMAPPLWIVNSVLMYTVNPQMAAEDARVLDANSRQCGAGDRGEPEAA
jgi:hypothetical protein